MKPTNFTPEKCLAYAFLSKMGDLKLQYVTQVGSPKEYTEKFEQLADLLAENLSVWRSVEYELPEYAAHYLVYDGVYFYTTTYYPQIKRFCKGHESIKFWQPINLPKDYDNENAD